MSMQRRLLSERGESKAGCLIWTVVLAAGILISVRVIPIKIATIELKDKMEDAAQLMPRGTVKQYQTFIVQRAQELNLPVTKKEVKVKKYPNRVVMDVSFTVPLDLIVTTYNWDISLHVDRDIFLI